MNDDPPKPSRGRPRTFDRDRVLDVAVAAYWKDDPTTVSVNALCQRAGISKPSLYREFGSEDGLSAAVLETYAGIVLTRIVGLLEAPQPFDETLAQLVRFVSEGELFETGCLYVKMRAAKPRLGAATQATIEALDAHGLEVYRGFLARGRASGEWDGCIPLDLAASYLSAQVNLALSRRARGDDPDDIREVLRLALSVFGVGR